MPRKRARKKPVKLKFQPQRFEVDLGAAPLEGCRLFALDRKSLLLTSLNKVGYANGIWLPNTVMRSRCDRAALHPDVILKPEVACTCGFWSCKGRRGLALSFPSYGLRFEEEGFSAVSARIQIWGRVIEHQWGYRSEFARIIPETIQWWPRPSTKYHYKLLMYVREKYGA